MSTQNAHRSVPVPPLGGGVVVPRPGVVHTIGGALNKAFARKPELPDDMAALLDRLDGKTDHFDGE